MEDLSRNNDFDAEITVPEIDNVKQKKTDIKRLSLKLGLSIIIMFAMRIAASFFISLFLNNSDADMSLEMKYFVQALISLIFVYIIPIISTVLLLKKERTNDEIKLFSGTQYFGRAMSTLPTIYGIPFILNIIMMVIINLIGKSDMMDSFNTVNDLSPNSFGAALILFVELTVIAPIFEEIWFRGIIFRKLYPYGSGFGIIISGIIFGLAHGNFQQFFYTTALGICLAYITYATKSIVAPIVIHAFFNAIAGGLILFASSDTVGDYLMNEFSSKPEKPLEIIFIFYAISIIIFAIIGAATFFAKLSKAKRYRTPSIFPEISLGRKIGIFFSRVTVILGIILALDIFTYNFILKGVSKLIG